MSQGIDSPDIQTGEQIDVSRSRNSFLGDFLANFKRWIMKFFRSPHVLIMNLVQPVMFLLLFTQVFGETVSGPITKALKMNVEYATYLLPAITIQVSIMTAQGAGMGLVRDMEEWIFEKVMVSPMRKSAVFLGKTASEILRISIQTAIIITLGVFIGAEITTGIFGAFGLIGVGILFSLIFISLTTIIAVTTKDQESMASILMPLIFPLMFLSSAFLPLNAMPNWIQTFAKFNPVTYGVDAARAIVLNKDVMTVLDINSFSGVWNTIIPALLVLLGLGIVLGGIAVFTIKRETSSDVR